MNSSSLISLLLSVKVKALSQCAAAYPIANSMSSSLIVQIQASLRSHRRPSYRSFCQHCSDDAFIKTTSVNARPKSKWDDLVDEDGGDGDELNNISIDVSPDMLYTEANIRRQANTYDQLESIGGKDVINDVYVRAPGESEWWLVGKTARISDVSPERSIERQWPLIERHVWALRLPVRPLSDLSAPFEVWYAPGDSELDAARNDPGVHFTKISHLLSYDGAGVPASFVGFVGKTYNEPEGQPVFFVERNVTDGSCLRGREMEGDWI